MASTLDIVIKAHNQARAALRELQGDPAKRKRRQEVTAQIEKWSVRRDSYKAQKLDMLGVSGANMTPLDNGIAHANRMVQFWTRELQELGYLKVPG